MKNKFLKRLVAATFCLGIAFMPLKANATTYISGIFMGDEQDSDPVYLGSGTRYLYGTGYIDNGTAYAMKINALAPDTKVAKIRLLQNRSNSKSFTAESVTSVLESEQEYYIKWDGLKSSKAWVAMSN